MCEKNSFDFLKKSGIDNHKWQIDSIGCLMYRDQYADTILAYQKYLINRDKKEILSLFGEANYINKKAGGDQVYIYIIERSLLCNNAYEFDTVPPIEASSIFFLFDNTDRLIQVGKKVP